MDRLDRTSATRTTFGSQTDVRAADPGHVRHQLPVHGRPVGGAWGGPVSDSQYVWLPIAFPSNTTMSLSWSRRSPSTPPAGTVTGGRAAVLPGDQPAQRQGAWTSSTQSTAEQRRGQAVDLERRRQPEVGVPVDAGGGYFQHRQPAQRQVPGREPAPPPPTAPTSSSTPAAAAPTSSGSGTPTRRLLAASGPAQRQVPRRESTRRTARRRRHPAVRLRRRHQPAVAAPRGVAGGTAEDRRGRSGAGGDSASGRCGEPGAGDPRRAAPTRLAVPPLTGIALACLSQAQARQRDAHRAAGPVRTRRTSRSGSGRVDRNRRRVAA